MIQLSCQKLFRQDDPSGVPFPLDTAKDSGESLRMKKVSTVARKYQQPFREYRGRRGGSAFLKVVIVLLVLVLLAVLVFALVLGGSLEYTDEGVRVVLPWLEQQPDPAESPSLPASADPPVFVVDEPDEPEPDPVPEPDPDPAPALIGAVEVPVDALTAGTAADTVRAAGGNTLVVEMKSASGKVYWDSAAALPGAASGETAAVTDAVRLLAQDEELYLVARVVCFRDQLMAADGLGGPLMTRGGNVWYDANGLRWVSPASEEGRAYIISLCTELAELGFDEILLEHSGYPYFGETHVLAVDTLRPEELSGPVEEFWQELRAALESAGVRLSMLVTPTMAEGSEPYSGITPELLNRYAHRVWTAQLPADSELAEKLVRIGGTEADGSWAKIDPTVN